MAAESPSRSKLGLSTIVHPQHVTDPTILDGVAGFINDFVPTAYTIPSDNKDQIQWARFEQLEQDVLNEDKVVPAPLLLILGYTTGMQVWAIFATGDAKELLSWKHGCVRVLTTLPNPERIDTNSVDLYSDKRPLVALCDNVAPGNDFCSLCFISLKTGEQVKLIKFKNPVVNVIANKRSVVASFAERIAIFDSFTLEDRSTVTTCYLSPGIHQNPIALGTCWMAYAENKLIPSRRSSGGLDGEGAQSYTATVLHAAKSIGRGLRELGETVASSLTGQVHQKPGLTPVATQAEVLQKGIVSIINIETSANNDDAMIAHFVAHKHAIVCLQFDHSGLLLLTADNRGHDFHLFRVQPHPAGSALAALHHLYILHRGDTSARVQDMTFSSDSRWATVSTLRGTTHVFPITPYGGHVGVRTHATPHVVNKMSRFHRSAGLSVEGRSNSPVSTFEMPRNTHMPYLNPRLPPYPHATVVLPLAQIRQPLFNQPSTSTQSRTSVARHRSDDNSSQVTLRVTACFASPRAWIESPSHGRPEAGPKPISKPVESLFIISLHGSLIQYDLEPRSSSSVPKEKVCDDTQIELDVCAKAQWVLQRTSSTKDAQLPLSPADLLAIWPEHECKECTENHLDDKWLSQVEIVTHAGPHRRLWMGPQFTFKTYNNNAGTCGNIIDAQLVDIGRSKPVTMPMNTAYPILIEAGSLGSCDLSPKLINQMQKQTQEAGENCTGESQLREDLADAMLESPGAREAGGRCVIVSMKPSCCGSVAKVVNPLGMVVTVQSDDDDLPSASLHNDGIIHENCDESLFRPVVASKLNVRHQRSPVRQGGVLENIQQSNNVLEEQRQTKTKQVSQEATIEVLQDAFYDATEACHDLIIAPDILSSAHELDFDDGGDLRIPMVTSIDVVDAEYCPSDVLKSHQEKEVISSSEEATVYEEKHFTKKPRKPKTKLGIRISSLPKEEPRTWSSVASGSKVRRSPIPLDERANIENIQELPNTSRQESNDELLRVEKPPSDETSSSPTESDDSSKVPAVVVDSDEDPKDATIDLKPKSTSNNCKSKKNKKKRR